MSTSVMQFALAQFAQPCGHLRVALSEFRQSCHQHVFAVMTAPRRETAHVGVDATKEQISRARRIERHGGVDQTLFALLEQARVRAEFIQEVDGVFRPTLGRAR